jgi:hypothetical protein
VNTRFITRSLVVGVLSLALAPSARPVDLQTEGTAVVVGIVVAAVAIGLTTTFLILHHRAKPSAITGCVGSEGNTLNIKDERDQRIYGLTGSLVGVKAGDRMRLTGKRGGGKLMFRVRQVTEDFGVCQR